MDWKLLTLFGRRPVSDVQQVGTTAGLIVRAVVPSSQPEAQSETEWYVVRTTDRMAALDAVQNLTGVLIPPATIHGTLDARALDKLGMQDGELKPISFGDQGGRARPC